MALNYAEKWQPELLQIRIQGTLTSPFITDNVRWLDARTFHFTGMRTSGFRKHSRQGGFNRGKYSQFDVPFTIKHSRDVEFFIDKADVLDTNGTAKAENIAKTFTMTQAAPETDAYFYAKIAQIALGEIPAYPGAPAVVANSLSSVTAASTYTKANVFQKLKAMLTKAKLRRYRGNGSLVGYVTSEIMDLLEQSDSFTRKIEMTQIAEGGIGLETRVTDIDGVPIIEVIDDERFYDKFHFVEGNEEIEDGFTLVAKDEGVRGSRKINVLFASTQTTFTVPRVQSIYMFAPGEHTEGDGYLYQHREDWDTFVFPDGNTEKIDSIFVDVDTVEYEG